MNKYKWMRTVSNDLDKTFQMNDFNDKLNFLTIIKLLN